MRKISVLASIILLPNFLFAQESFKPLVLDDLIRLNQSTADYAPKKNMITGSALLKDQMLFVVGTPMNEEIFSINKNSEVTAWARMNDTLSSDFTSNYIRPIKEKTNSLTDLQGLAMCARSEKPAKQTFFVVNGFMRDILKYEVENQQIISYESMGETIWKDLQRKDSQSKVQSLFERDSSIQDHRDEYFFGTENKYDQNGLKGIAVNCANNTLYVAKSQNPAYVLAVDFDGTIVSLFPVLKSPQADRSEPSVVSDLAFLDNNLFILEKNASKIIEINSVTEEWIATYDFSAWDKSFGEMETAETLAVKKDGSKKIFYVGFSNGTLNEKGFGLFGCDEKNFEDKTKKQYLHKKNCLDKGATNSIVLKFEEKK